MLTSPDSEEGLSATRMSAARLGRWIAFLLAVVAATAFALGITTPPRSGPFCAGSCIAYPYTDVVQYVPRDYLWVAPGILLTPLFVVLAGCIHACVPAGKRGLSLIGLCFASISAGMVTLDYFIQSQVVEPSLVRGETSGLALFTQYNPHGFFIALEDTGLPDAERGVSLHGRCVWPRQSPGARNPMDLHLLRTAGFREFHRPVLEVRLQSRVPV